jgi:N-acetylglucosamine kinase-like BadF-type ATPase
MPEGQSRQRGRYLLAIDGGQTSTKALISTLDGQVLAAGRGGPSDHFHIAGGVEKNRLALHGAIDSVLASAGLTPADVAAMAMGLTGAPPEGPPRQVVYDVVAEIVQPEKVTVLPDYITNLTGASAGGPGVVIVAGGGAIGYGITTDGREAIASGFGYLLGDEGSAFKIGLAAIRAAAFDWDKRGEPTVLKQIVCDYFEIDEFRKITQVVYRAGFQRDRISLLTPLVVKAAAGGDRAAAGILDDAGHSLGLIGLGVIRQLFQPGNPVEVFLTGGVFNIGEPIVAPMTHTLAAGWPEAKTRAPRFQPAVGGLIVAARSLGLEIDDAWLRNVETSMATLA